METLRQTQKKYGSRAMMAGILVALAFILAGYKPIGRGVMLGTIFSVINFVLMGELLPRRLGQTKRRATAGALGSIGFRYVLMAIPLYVAIQGTKFNLPAVICGLFMIQIMILLDNVVKRFFPGISGDKSDG